MAKRSGEWTFLTNHAHVLICISLSPSLTTREISEVVGITERAVQGIVADLVQENYLTKKREGRNNHYRIDRRRKLRHTLESHNSLSALLELGPEQI